MCDSIDFKEELIRDYKNKLIPYFSNEDIVRATDILMSSLFDYKVSRESREVSVLVDDYNDKMLNVYLNCLSIEGKSKRTIIAYKNELMRLNSFINKHYNQIGTYDLRYYLASIKSRNVTNTTLENSRANLSAFFRWMESEGFIQKNPMAPIKPIKINPKKEEPFLSSEIDAIRFACKNSKERALIEVALSSGLRCEELSRLRLSDIDIRNNEVHVRHGKGDKDRISYMSELAAKCVEKYVSERTDDMDILFLSRNNGGSFYSARGIYKLIKEIGARSGVENVHPHRFRHTMASTLAERGMQINEIKEILGHSDVTTTMRYIHTEKTSVKASYKKFSG